MWLSPWRITSTAHLPPELVDGFPPAGWGDGVEVVEHGLAVDDQLQPLGRDNQLARDQAVFVSAGTIV